MINYLSLILLISSLGKNTRKRAFFNYAGFIYTIVRSVPAADRIFVPHRLILLFRKERLSS